MEKKYLKILTSSLSLSLLIPLASCNIGLNDSKQIKSIQITTQLNDLTLEVDEKYSSNPIVIKCFDSNGNEIEANTQLTLISLSSNSIDINIVNNQIVIGSNKKVGNYKYQLLAYSGDGSIVSEPKEFNVDVYKKTIEPDSLDLQGNNSCEFYYPDSKTINYEIIAKKDNQPIKDYKGDYVYEILIKSSQTKLDKDLFNNPLFSLTIKDNILSLNVSKNIDSSYQGKYDIELKIWIRSNPNVYANKILKLELINGIEFDDKTNQAFYKRNDVNSPWYLSLILSDKTVLETDKFLNEIYGYEVNKIGNNFCDLCNIKNMVLLKLSNNIKYIGDHAFEKQEALTSLYIQDALEIGDYAFKDCKLAMVDPSWAFKFKKIGKYAFSGCDQFEGKYFLDVEELGDYCFESTSMSEIHFGSKLELIGCECLSNCSNLQNIYIKSINPPKLLGVLYAGSTPCSCKIHVPAQSIEKYKNDPNFKIYQENLVGDITM